MTNAERKDLELQQAARQGGINLSPADARILRRAEMTLHRWDEEMCNGTIQRPWQEDTGDPDAYVGDRPGRSIGGYTDDAGTFHEEWMFVPDRERGAIKRIEAVCKKYAAPNGSPLKYYHQSDPRGAALYISPPYHSMNEVNYSLAVSCAVR
jgi:hypothetical protein